MLSGSWDKTIVDWDLNTGKTIRKFADTMCHWWTLRCTFMERYGQITIIYEIRADVVANLLGLFYALDPGEVGLVNDHSTYIHWCFCLITEHVLLLKYPLPKEFRVVAKGFRAVAKGFRAVAKGFRAVAKGFRAVAKGFRAVANEIWIKGGSAKLRCMFCNKSIVPTRYCGTMCRRSGQGGSCSGQGKSNYAPA